MPRRGGGNGWSWRAVSTFFREGIDISRKLCYYCHNNVDGLWLSLVERRVRDADVAGSNPVNPTIC